MPTATHTYGATISFSPKWWSYVTSTRVMVSSFCNVQLADEDVADKIAMAAQELLENAVKYSADHDHEVTLSFEIVEEREVTLMVTNQAKPEALEGLRAFHKEISEGDPLMVYLTRMQRIANDPEAEGSQLGLARIRFETGQPLELKIEGERVTFSVTLPLSKAKG